MDALERFRQLAAWLAETDIALLELRGPQFLLRLLRDGATDGRTDGWTDGSTDLEPAPAQPQPGTTIVAASTVGIVRHRHPLRDGPLAPPGARVERGQALVLLQIGQLLVQVSAPRDATVAGLLGQDGDAVGYGAPLIELRD